MATPNYTELFERAFRLISWQNVIEKPAISAAETWEYLSRILTENTKIRTGTENGMTEAKSMKFPLGRGSLQRERINAHLDAVEEAGFGTAGERA